MDLYGAKQVCGEIMFLIYELKLMLFLIADKVYHEPTVLLNILEHLESLSPGKLIEFACLDNYLLEQRLELGEDNIQCHYIPQYFHQRNRGEDNDLEAVEGYRRQFNYRAQNPPRPACVVVHGGLHWWGLVVDRQRNTAYALGRGTSMKVSIHGSRTWGSWDGPEIWRRICQIQGWNEDLPERVIELDWTQVGGRDCGAHIGGVLEAVQRHGLRIGGSGLGALPKVPCVHQTRLKMVRRLYEVCMVQLRRYYLLAQTTLEVLDEMWQTVELKLSMLDERVFDEEMNIRMGIVEYARRPTEGLSRAIDNCRECQMR